MRWSSIKPNWLIRRQAAQLLVRADADPSPENLARVERWRLADPRQGEALAKAETVLGVASLLPKPAAPARRRPTTSSPGLAIAASIAAASLILPAAFLLLAGPRGGAKVEAAMLVTGPGETREAKLADGTSVSLGTSTAVRVDVSKGRREATVERGRATFRVVRDPRPFQVRAGDRSALVEEGVIEVVETRQDQHMRIVEGRGTVSGMVSEPRAPAMIAELPPTEGEARLSFDDVRLSEIVSWANQAGTPRIVIADPEVSALRVTGVYARGDTAALARSLARAFGLELRATATGTIELGLKPH